MWYRDVDLQSSVYDNHLEASIFYSAKVYSRPPFYVHIIEFMVWISKVYRTTAVLFMVVEEVRSLLSMLPALSQSLMNAFSSLPALLLQMFNRVFKFLVLMLFSILRS